jgi:acetyl/propionyl-CoA carboxylase alpha subunit
MDRFSHATLKIQAPEATWSHLSHPFLNFGIMYKNTINDSHTFSMEPGKDGLMTINGEKVFPNIIAIRPGLFHVIIDGRSTEAEVMSANSTEKTFLIRIHGNIYKVQVADRFDALLRDMGMDMAQSRKASDMKAPMPGLVSEVAVEEGQTIKKGDKLIVLEAMKMENILKAPEDGVIKKVVVSKGKTVEKNEVLITFQ